MRLELQKIERPMNAPEASSPEELKKLASLGYVTITGAGANESNLPDPKDRIASLHAYKKLFALFFASQYAEAIGVARELLAQEPKIISAWRILAESLAKTGKHGEAIRTLELGLQRAGQSGVGEEISDAYELLATLLARRGDIAGAERVSREALARNLATVPLRHQLVKILAQTGRSEEALAILAPLSDSQDVETLDSLAVSLAESGHLAQARSTLLRAVQMDPANPDVLTHLGALSLREKDPGTARDWFEKALEKNPKLPGTLTSLGTALVQLGEDQRALESWKKALELDPEQYDALFNIALLSGRHAQFDEARRCLERFAATAPPDRYREQLAEAKRLLRGMKAKS
jgi:tetratricopeptide (TPR) repeat protein